VKFRQLFKRLNRHRRPGPPISEAVCLTRKQNGAQPSSRLAPFLGFTALKKAFC